MRFLAFALCLAIVATFVLYFFYKTRAKLRKSERYRERIEALLQEIGAVDLGGDAHKFEGARFLVKVEVPISLSTMFDLSVSVFTRQSHDFGLNLTPSPAPRSNRLAADDFYAKFAFEGMIRREAEDYLLSDGVKNRLRELLAANFARASFTWCMTTVSSLRIGLDAMNAEILSSTLRALKYFKENPATIKHYEGFLTLRTGFEQNLLGWHWKADAVKTLPEDFARVCVSFNDSHTVQDRKPAGEDVTTMRYLNPVVLFILEELAGAAPKFVLCGRYDEKALEYSFGHAKIPVNNLFEWCEHDVMAAADNLSDGEFFKGFVAIDPNFAYDVKTAFERKPAYALHEIAVANIDKLNVYARRLMDDEASWYTGEYEILARLNEQRIADVINAASAKFNLKVVRLEERFNPKMFTDERFEFTT